MYLYDPTLGKISFKANRCQIHYRVSEYQDKKQHFITPGGVVYKKITAKRVGGSYILTYPDKTTYHFKHVKHGNHVLHMKELPDKSCYFYEFEGFDLKSVKIAKHKNSKQKSQGTDLGIRKV